MGGAGDLIKQAVMSWPGVEAHHHRFGGTEYRYGRKEMGHVHGDRLADLPLPRKLHDAVIAAGRARPHHVLPETGWVSCWMAGPEDAAGVIDLFRMQYDRYRNAAIRESGSTRKRQLEGLEHHQEKQGHDSDGPDPDGQ